MEKGIWYEAERDRYRVRLYRNNVPYLAGYYPTYPAAVAAWIKLRQKLDTIPKLRKGQRPPKRVYGASTEEIIKSSKQEHDPNLSLIK